MLALTAEIGRPVTSSDGLSVGRLIDLSARVDHERPRVYRLAVGQRRRIRYLIPWSDVDSFEQASLRLRRSATLLDYLVQPTTLPKLGAGELLLARDVLDTQVVDVDRHRVARVAEVLLDQRPEGELDVVGVDVGVSGLLRRLGLRRLGDRLPGEVIAWGDLHMTADRGHASQLATSTAAVHRLGSRDLAELLTRLRVESAADVIETVGSTRAAHAVARTHPDVGRSLLRALEPDQADRLVRAMPRESAARYRRIIARERSVRRRALRLSGWRLNRPPTPPGHVPRTP